MSTREGNPIYLKNSPFRNQRDAIKNTYGSYELCANCKHLGDICATRLRVFQRVVKVKTKPEQIIAVDGIARSWVIECDGFEQHA